MLETKFIACLQHCVLRQSLHNKQVKYAPFGRWVAQKARAPYLSR